DGVAASQLARELERLGPRALLALCGADPEASLDQGHLAIVGELGTPVHDVARVLHATSSRAAGPFLRGELGALEGPYLEALVFGKARGVWPAVEQEHVGLLEQASGGTLVFTDELLASPRLARILTATRSGQLARLGDPTPRLIDVRLFVTCQGELAHEQAVLFPARVRLKPLRERRWLVHRRVAESGLRFTPEALAALDAHAWPGNDAELATELSRLSQLAPREPIPLGSLHARIRRSDVELPPFTRIG